MGYADGFYYGQGRIICDTSTFSVGDTIRVRSVYNVSQTEDKQVVTVGTPLIFTVPPYDYYKVCKVVTISDVETEVGGEFVTIDYGQTHRSTVLDKESFTGIKAILNAHLENDVLNIGDTVNTKVSGNPWGMEIAGIDMSGGRNVVLVSKTCYGNTNSLNTDQIANRCNDFYTNLDETDKALVEQIRRQVLTNYNTGSGGSITYKDYMAYGWTPTRSEMDGTTLGSRVVSNVQFPLFTTQANRVRHDSNGNAINWWTHDTYGWVAGSVQQTQGWRITDVGAVNQIAISNGYYIIPCVRISADL